MNRQIRWASLLLLLALGALVWTSSQLAALRIYQVDECQNIYMASVLAKGLSAEFFTNASLFLLGPLSWITTSALKSADVFQMARLVFLGVFWLNLLLLASIAGGKLYSAKALLALVAAASLAPLWDYGFEVRHDNVVLAGILLIWWAIRVKPMGVLSYCLAGVTGVVLVFVAVKSVVYVVPLAAAILAVPPPAFKFSRTRLAAWFFGGAAVAAIFIRFRYGTGGSWETYISVFGAVAKCTDRTASASPTFAPWSTLARMLSQTPLLLGIGLAACCAVVKEIIQRGKAAITWEHSLPEFVLFLGALGALAINPTPFPYNLVNVVPYLFLFAFQYASRVFPALWEQRSLHPLLIGVVTFTHMVPFLVSTRRHWDRLNWRQERLMTLSEDLTEPNVDLVYDGIGMVPTRKTIAFQWYLHSLNIKGFLDGTGPRVCDMLAAKPPSVLIPSYRTDWLSEIDHDFIRERYVPLADDFWVLGKTLPVGGGNFEVYHRGRYRISTLKGSDISGTYPLGMEGALTPEDPGTLDGTLDGQPLTNRPVELCEGTHRIECEAGCQAAVVWMGPHLDRVHRLGPSDHRQLFVNWY